MQLIVVASSHFVDKPSALVLAFPLAMLFVSRFSFEHRGGRGPVPPEGNHSDLLPGEKLCDTCRGMKRAAVRALREQCSRVVLRTAFCMPTCFGGALLACA